jgi:alkanesulfonate monooxygenase SsuD/methylene tetrahydromethanopterin reductase-like flavin-dependent oxidoreductase (luciferase family)
MIEPQEGMTMEQILEWALYAERMNYGYIFRSDHLLALGGEEEVKKKDGASSPECWVSLGAIAAKTTKIKFGPMVSPVGFRNPALLARMACTLDSYSNGRMCLGLGAGWYEFEYIAHGFDFPAFKVRRKQAEEGYKIVREITEGKRVDFDGEYFSAHVECSPKPTNGKVHFIGGGRQPRIVRTLAKYVDEWNLFNTSKENYLKLREVLEQSKPFNKRIEITQMGSFVIAKSESELEQKLHLAAKVHGTDLAPAEFGRKLKASGRLCGAVEEFVEQLNDIVDSGIERFYFQVLDPNDKEMVTLLTDTLKSKF